MNYNDTIKAIGECIVVFAHVTLDMDDGDCIQVSKGDAVKVLTCFIEGDSVINQYNGDAILAKESHELNVIVSEDEKSITIGY